VRWAMSMPDLNGYGLGLRRLQWTTQEKNKAAHGLAKKMRFTYEGTLRCEDVLRIGQHDEGQGGFGTRRHDRV